MKRIGTIVGMLGFSLALALAGCAASTEEQDPEVLDSPTGEAASAQHYCWPGSEYVYEAGMCVSQPYTIDYTPGARGCTNGAVISGRGNTVCIRYAR